MPQGSILGPFLFIMYVNDLPSAVPDVDITMYADDTAMIQLLGWLMKLNNPCCQLSLNCVNG